jgi:hypothetical protein
MPKIRIHAVIEAIRTTPGGRIEFVRLFERRGAVWSDRLLVSRADLMRRLEQGQRVVTGHVKPLLGFAFEAGDAVRFQDGSLTAGAASGGKDLLPGVPSF